MRHAVFIALLGVSVLLVVVFWLVPRRATAPVLETLSLKQEFKPPIVAEREHPKDMTKGYHLPELPKLGVQKPESKPAPPKPSLQERIKGWLDVAGKASPIISSFAAVWVKVKKKKPAKPATRKR